MNTWYAAKTENIHDQGLVINEITGENIAVTYKSEHAPIIAASPELADMLDDLLCLVEGRNRPEVIEKKIRQYGEFARRVLK